MLHLLHNLNERPNCSNTDVSCSQALVLFHNIKCSNKRCIKKSFNNSGGGSPHLLEQKLHIYVCPKMFVYRLATIFINNVCFYQISFNFKHYDCPEDVKNNIKSLKNKNQQDGMIFHIHNEKKNCYFFILYIFLI